MTKTDCRGLAAYLGRDDELARARSGTSGCADPLRSAR